MSVSGGAKHKHKPQTQSRQQIQTQTHGHKRKQQRQQLYLDFGQASFGSRSICPICNTLIVHGIREDEEQHEKICSDYRLGVAFHIRKNVRIVSVNNGSVRKLRCGEVKPNQSINKGSISQSQLQLLLPLHLQLPSIMMDKSINNDTRRDLGYVVEIRQGDGIQLRRKALAVKRIVDQELGFSVQSQDLQLHRPSGDGFHSDLNVLNCDHDDDVTSSRYGHGPGRKDEASLGRFTIFMYILNKRVVGFCSVEVITNAYRLLLEENRDGNGDASVIQKVNEKKKDNIGNSNDEEEYDDYGNEERNDAGNLLSEQSTSLSLSRKRKRAMAENVLTHAAVSESNLSDIDSDTKNIEPTEYPKTYARSTKPTPAIMGVHQLWCHRSHRHKSIASKLVDAARSKVVYGMIVPHDSVAFSSPTADGARFARRYSHPDAPLVYECR